MTEWTSSVRPSALRVLNPSDGSFLARSEGSASTSGEQLAVERPLVDERFETNGVDLFVQHLGSLLNVSRNGQQAMAGVMRQYLRCIDRNPSGVPIKLYPLTRSTGHQEEQPKFVVIDPRLSLAVL